MTTRRRYRKRLGKILEILMMVSLVALGVLSALAVGYVYVNCSIYKNQHSVEIMSKELETLQQQIDTVEIEREEYKKQMDALQAQLAKYQEIIIPDSMQENK